MTRKSKARYNLNRTYKVSPTVKALRRALALGLATAAVAPAAQAGTCIDVINDVFCFGDFGDTTVDSWGALSVYDTFDPATVEFDGTIYTDNNRGIVAWNFDDMAFANDGAVILNDSNNTDSWSSVGVYAESFQGDVAFDNTGVIAVVRDNGDWSQTAVSARVEAAQDITITNSGFIASENDGGFTAGLQAVSYGGGTINITNTVTGDFAAEANDYGDAVALGVYSSGGTVNISTDGDVGAASLDQAFGIRVFSGDTTITAGSTSEINVRGFDAYGIYVETGNNTVDISNAGHIETDAFDDAYGIRVLSPVNGDVTVSNSGSIDSYAATDWAAGIAVYAGGGNVSVTNSQYGTILSDGNDDSAGISVRSYTGDISVRNDGAIYSTSENALGIATFGKYNNTVQISNSGSIDAYAQVGGSTSAAGVYALGYNNDTTVINSGDIVAAGGNMNNAGVAVFAAGTDDYGTVTVVNSGTIDAIADNYFGGNSGAGDAFGVYVLANGNVTVENTGSYVYGEAAISAYSEFGDVAAGVLAISSNGDVSVTNSNKYSYIGAFAGSNVINNGNPYSTSFGIYAEASDGSVSVNNAGVVLAYNSSNSYGMAGGSAIGIRANAYESDSLAPLAAYMSDGDITVSNTGLVLAISKYDNASGVQASSNYGDITISNAGSSKYSPGQIYAAAQEGYAAGIQAITGGDGSITISNSGGYVIADGYSGAVGIAASTDSGDIVVTNAESDGGYGGVIAAFADSSGYYSGNAAGVSAYSYYGNMGIYNSGEVAAHSSYGSAAGIRATTGDHSNGTIYVANTGDVGAYGYSGTFGISANTYSGNITINNTVDDNGNSGVIVAVNRGEGYAYGIDANINDNYSSANINIVNGYGALINSQANFAGEVSDAYGIRAYNAGYGDILVNNAGVIGAQAYDDAYAIWAYAGGDGNISITNTETGSLYAESVTDDAYGVYAYAHGNGSIGVTNSGSISVISSGNGGDGFGIYAYADGDGNVTVSNSGSILAQTSGDYGDVYGVYAYANGDGYVSVTNSGTIVATATGDYGAAYGIYAGTENEGNISIANTGSITASSAGYDSNAIGIYAYSDDGSYISVTNGQYGSITVNTSGANSFAAGIEVENDDSDNYGSIVSITNNGTVTVGTTGYGSNANGIWTHGGGTHDADVYITNNGSFDVTTTGLYADAWGIEVDDIRGDTLVDVLNSGDVTVAASYGYAFGIQTETFGFETETQITNYGGNLTVSTGGDSLAIGIGAYAYGAGYGDITVTNTLSGYVDVSSAYGSATGIGIYADMDGNLNDGGSISIANAGDIAVQGYGEAHGINVAVNEGNNYTPRQYSICPSYSTCQDVYGNYINTGLFSYYFVSEASSTTPGQGGMPVTVTNSGSIDVTSDYSNAEGITVDMGAGSYGEMAWVTNSGSIDVVTENGFTALGIHVDNQWGDINVSNTASGTIDVANESELYYGGYYGYHGGGYAVGIRTYGYFANTTISNAGDITVGNSPWRSNGIRADNKYGDVTVSNLAGGSISVDTSGLDAYGIEVDNKYGDVTVSNAGSITVSTGYWNSKGIEVDNDHGDTVISTAVGSSITVTGDGYRTSGGILGYSQSGDITVTNAGGLTVTADYFATGIHLYSDYGDVSVTNSGAMSVSSASGNAQGIYAETGDGTSSVTNSAAITVTAADYAVGIYAYANGGDASVTNNAAGHVSVTGDSATGISVQSNSYGYDVTLNNAGKITVVGNDGDAYGAYVETDGYGTLNITSSGDITVTSSGYNTYAVGLYAQHEDYGDVNVTSSSKITVTNNSDYGDAVGIRAMSENGSAITVTNSGTILASTSNAYGFSAGIYTENFNGSSTTITNSGSVKATGDYAYAIYHYGTDVDITNSNTGKIFGVIVTDYGDDTFTNNGKWYATEGVNYLSDFQEGDDNIVNSATGKIYMEDSYIDLGSATTVNSFLNNGKLYVNGDENYINMGTATSVFTNNGASLHFEDGAANDVLTIFGDFAGTGHIVVDANGTSMLADRLYIEGDVVSNTANVIDVYLDENPSLQDMVDGELIDIVYVSGTSAAANFNLGIVDVEDDLLYTVDYELVKQINYSGTNDLFSLGFEISGLTPTGVAMSSIAPAVQNLWHLGVGTVFQREGTMRDSSGTGSANSLMNAGFKNATGGNAQVADYQGAAGLWLRAFTEDGGLNPTAGRGNFGLGGEQSFDMKNSGLEFGAGYAFNSQWTIGLLGGVSDGTVKPTIGGRTTIDAKTIGGYMTFTPGNGFYADLSYRSMDFDGDGNGGGDDFSFEGTADGFSLEVGYGLKTASGLVVEPQFQYSSMDVNLDDVDYNQDGFDLADGKSSQTRLGVALRKTMDSGNGNSWTPYVSLSYVNESNASNDYVIGGVLTGNVDTSGNSTLFEGGLTAKYSNMLFSGGLNWKDGGAYESMFGGQVSVRFTW